MNKGNLGGSITLDNANTAVSRSEDQKGKLDTKQALNKQIVSCLKVQYGNEKLCR